MQFITFTGYSDTDLTAAVIQAHDALHEWTARHATVIMMTDRVEPTSQVVRGTGGMEYWFTLTIAFREVRR